MQFSLTSDCEIYLQTPISYASFCTTSTKIFTIINVHKIRIFVKIVSFLQEDQPGTKQVWLVANGRLQISVIQFLIEFTSLHLPRHCQLSTVLKHLPGIQKLDPTVSKATLKNVFPYFSRVQSASIISNHSDVQIQKGIITSVQRNEQP